MNIFKMRGFTKLIFENEKIRGDIEITKISADDNEKTGEKKGTTLKGAIFEVYNENDMLVDTIVTDENGKAKSKLLEYGKYYVKEKSTGSDYYLLNTEKYYVEITENGKTIPVTIENTSIKVEKELPKTFLKHSACIAHKKEINIWTIRLYGPIGIKLTITKIIISIIKIICRQCHF